MFAVNRLQLTEEAATWYQAPTNKQALIHQKFINQVCVKCLTSSWGYKIRHSFCFQGVK